VGTICLVNALFPPHGHGGAENYVRRAAEGLTARGHEVAVVTTEPYDGRDSLRPARERRDGYDVWRFAPINVSHLSEGTGSTVLAKALYRGLDLANLPAARTVGGLIDRLEPDVVHTNNLFGISTLVGRAVGGRGIRHVHTLHDYGLLCPKSSLLRDLTAPEGERTVCERPPAPCRAYARARLATLGEPDLVTAPSRHVIDVHREHGHLAGVESRRLRLGVDGVADEPSPPGDRALLFAGQQRESKGLETLFAAADRLPETTIHVCGDGPEAGASERAAASRSNLEYHGFVPTDRLAALRDRVAAAVVPSIWMENSPLTIYESYAAGLPVLGSRIGGIPELVEPGETGFLFEPGDPAALAAAARRLFDADGAALSRAALAWAGEHTMIAHLDRLVEEVYRL
jgi:glycosyltransferase involved in cell wall biosynthesis